MKKLLLFCMLVLSLLPLRAETWTPVGQAQWTDPFWTSSGSAIVKNVVIERCDQYPGVYRTKPFTDSEYVMIHTESPDNVYITPYSHVNSSGDIIVVTQRCEENGVNSPYYGTFKNGVVSIPGSYFRSNVKGSKTYTNCGSERKLEIIFPKIEGDGIFMGIISFSDKLNDKSISLLNKDTEPGFVDFVNNMTVGNNTLLYYAVEQAVSTIVQPAYPDNLTNAIIITFTDGLDKGSLAMRDDMLNGKDYANYLSGLISKTKVNDVELQTYAIGLEGQDVVDKDLFMYNLQSLSSKPENAHKVDDIDGVNEELYKIYENLYRQTSQRVLKLSIPMPDHEARIRFTLDGVTDPEKVEQSTLWFDGTFDRLEMAMKDVTYGGFTSDSGEMINVVRDEQNALNILITLNDCRDENGEMLEIDQKNIKQWDYIASNERWQPNTEIEQDNNVKIDDIRTSAAIMLVLDCSTSLGDKFGDLKETAISFIDRLAGGDGNYSGIENVIIDTPAVEGNAPVEYYNLQGVRVVNPQNGLYIRRQGNNVSKVLIR